MKTWLDARPGTRQFFRYFLAGGAAFLVDFLALYVLTERLHVFYLVSAALSFVLGTLVNYVFCIRWVFDQRSFSDRSAELLVFALIGACGLVLNGISLWFFTEFIGFHYLFSKMIAAALTFAFNFGFRKLVVFSAPDHHQVPTGYGLALPGETEVAAGMEAAVRNG